VLPIQKLEKFAAHTWLGRRWGWVDPLKDIEASRLAIKTGIASPQMIAAQAGVDVEDVIQAIADFEQLVAESKVTLVNFADTASQQAAAQGVVTEAPKESNLDKIAAVMLARAADQALPSVVVHNHPPETNIHMGETRNEINVPAQPAPQVKVDVAAPNVTIEPAAVEVRLEATIPAQAAPVVEVNVDMPDEFKITAMPTRETTTKIERNSAGDITKSTQVERDT
jgi:hypothetical protein